MVLLVPILLILGWAAYFTYKHTDPHMIHPKVSWENLVMLWIVAITAMFPITVEMMKQVEEYRRPITHITVRDGQWTSERMSEEEARDRAARDALDREVTRLRKIK